jgi:hypothetical protein
VPYNSAAGTPNAAAMRRIWGPLGSRLPNSKKERHVSWMFVSRRTLEPVRFTRFRAERMLRPMIAASGVIGLRFFMAKHLAHLECPVQATHKKGSTVYLRRFHYCATGTLCWC